MKLNLRSIVMAAALAVSIACEPGVPPLAPIDASPGVEANAVRDGLDIFTETDVTRFIALAHKTLDQPIGNELRNYLLEPLERGKRAFGRLRTADDKHLLFVVHTESGFAGMVIDRSPTRKPIVPIDWIRSVVMLQGIDATALRAWCLALSERIANQGSASGIVVFQNGKSMGIVLDVRLNDDDGDEILAVRTKSFEKGETDVNAWGPRIDNPLTVTIKQMNHHQGMSIKDLLTWKLGAPPNQRGPFPDDAFPIEPPPDPNASPFPVAPSSQPSDAGASTNL